MPLPPPPAAALSMTGKPIFFAAASAASAFGKPLPLGPLSPGTTGVPAAVTVLRASVLLPILRIASALTGR